MFFRFVDVLTRTSCLPGRYHINVVQDYRPEHSPVSKDENVCAVMRRCVQSSGRYDLRAIGDRR